MSHTQPSPIIPESPAVERATFGGRYRFLRRLAQGGSGTVWSVHDNLGHFDKCAIKFPYCAPVDQTIRDRYRREAWFLAQLGATPYIVRPYDCGECDGLPYLVMELLGLSLRELMDLYRHDQTLLRLDLISSIIIQVCSALVVAHRNLWPGPILHLDINPNNVLLHSTAASRPAIKIVDFSSARFGRERDLLALPSEGTPGYMAPEQERGDRKALCPATDVFAIGVLALELLLLQAGQVSWLQHSVIGTSAYEDHTPWDSPLLSAKRADVPIALWHVVRQATRPSATERFGDAGALADAWIAAMAHAPAKAALADFMVPGWPALNSTSLTQPLPCPATEVWTQPLSSVATTGVLPDSSSFPLCDLHVRATTSDRAPRGTRARG